ncbi:hypothetical protein AVEN_138453-2-1, partial [Araneus ventricosus]
KILLLRRRYSSGELRDCSGSCSEYQEKSGLEQLASLSEAEVTKPETSSHGFLQIASERNNGNFVGGRCQWNGHL